MMKIEELKIDGLRGALRVAEERREETGTLSTEPYSEITASVTICQVRNKRRGLKDLQADVGASLASRDLLGIPRPGCLLTGTLFRGITVRQSFLDCPSEFLFYRAVASVGLTPLGCSSLSL